MVCSLALGFKSLQRVNSNRSATILIYSGPFSTMWTSPVVQIRWLRYHSSRAKHRPRQATWIRKVVPYCALTQPPSSLRKNLSKLMTMQMSHKMKKEGQCRMMKKMKKRKMLEVMRMGQMTRSQPQRWASWEGYQVSATQLIWCLASGSRRVWRLTRRCSISFGLSHSPRVDTSTIALMTMEVNRIRRTWSRSCCKGFRSTQIGTSFPKSSRTRLLTRANSPYLTVKNSSISTKSRSLWAQRPTSSTSTSTSRPSISHSLSYSN